jgi:hypothetical protein
MKSEFSCELHYNNKCLMFLAGSFPSSEFPKERFLVTVERLVVIDVNH